MGPYEIPGVTGAVSVQNASKDVKNLSDIYDQNQKSPLLKLPSELRNMIYEHVIGGHDVLTEPWAVMTTMGKVINYCSPKAAPIGPYTKPTTTLWNELFGLCKVCKQLYEETMILPFRLNTFHIGYRSFYENSCLLQDNRFLSITTISIGRIYGIDDGHIPIFNHQMEIDLLGIHGLTTVVALNTLKPAFFLYRDLFPLVDAFANRRGLKLVRDHEDNMYWPSLESWEE